jgi:hypothetical protein
MHQILKNKPKVFLSHSKKDLPFISNLCKDLRHCHIEPWLDSEDIHHGQPWLGAIFEIGIPTCDAVLVYLTESSIESPMVKKEIDASIIEKLKNQNIAFLPYVSEEKLRDRLRADIRSLQTPVWNEKNYKDILPRVVSEIWQSYLIRIVPSVINEEKVKRLEAELELEKIKKTVIDGIFDAREMAEFEFIWKQFNHHNVVKLSCFFLDSDECSKIQETHYTFKVHLQTIIPQLDKFEYDGYLLIDIDEIFKNLLILAIPTDEKRKQIEFEWSNLSDFINDLHICGLIKKEQKRNDEMVLISASTHSYNIVLTEKFYRFKYWLVYKDILSNKIEWEKCN